MHSNRAKKSERAFIYAILDMDTKVAQEEKMDQSKWDQALEVYWDVCAGIPTCVVELQNLASESSAKQSKLAELMGAQLKKPVVSFFLDGCIVC